MENKRKRSQFEVRSLSSEKELQTCVQIDHAFVTQSVWQMDIRDDDENISVRFRIVHFPREVEVPYPFTRQQLLLAWQKRDCFLVAATGDYVLGYAHMTVDDSQMQGYLHGIVVHKPLRRRRIGSALLDQVHRWSQIHNIQRVTLPLQTKNYPGITFAQKHGYAFCGYNDRYFPNQDIAVFFSRNI